MPTWLRNFTFREINKFYEEQNKKVNKKSLDLTDKTNIPEEAKPSYVTKRKI